MSDIESLKKLCRLIRYDILTATSVAGSGHPTSSLSAVELMTVLFFGGFLNFDINEPKNLGNDRVIFSKGHASPLLYSLYNAVGAISQEELLTLRKFGSVLEGHPTPRFKFVDVATGSLGQGLSVGVGMALAAKLKVKKELRIWVLLGDSEIDEGQVWEAIESATRYKLNNLIGILDVNKLGQYGQTDEGWHLAKYKKKFEAFGWNTIVIKDGHNLDEVIQAYEQIERKKAEKSVGPTILIAKTVKGKGVSFLENKDSWHGKALPKEQLRLALKDLGDIDFKIRGKIKTTGVQISKDTSLNSGPNGQSKLTNLLNKLEAKIDRSDSALSREISTREAYGNELVEMGRENPNLVVLDAGVANSTFENKFQKKFPDRFFEISIAEENMLGVALGLSKFGLIPFLSTFAAFLTQTFDQVRMAQYSEANLKIIGSHAGVSIGQDGPSQMGLEDLAMMRSILKSVVFYPSDGTSTKKLIRMMADSSGIFYLRATRGNTQILYPEKEEFKIGGCKVHKVIKSIKLIKPKVLIISAGITLHEALKAQADLFKDNLETVVIDCYSVKPLDEETLSQYITEFKKVIVVEDHYPYGGIGEAISRLITTNNLQLTSFTHLCVNKLPRSGRPEELLSFEEINSEAIVKKVKEMVKV